MSPLDSSEVSGLLIAQESITSAKVRWFIFALLAVAALLTMLTVWYWKRTDPRQRMAANRRAPVERAPVPRTTPLAADPPIQSGAWGGQAGPSASDAAADARRRAEVAGVAPAAPPLVPPVATHDDLEADDWLRLTGPQALPRDGA